MKIDRNFIWIWGYDLCNLRFKPYLNLCHLFLQIFYSYWKQIFSRFKQIDYKIDSSKQIGKSPKVYMMFEPWNSSCLQNVNVEKPLFEWHLVIISTILYRIFEPWIFRRNVLPSHISKSWYFFQKLMQFWTPISSKIDF